MFWKCLESCWYSNIPESKTLSCSIYIPLKELIRAYSNYKIFRHDKILDKLFEENFFDDIPNVTKLFTMKIVAFTNFENSHRKTVI